MIAIACAIGCDEKTEPPPARPQPTFGSATIRGAVKFTGTPPPRRQIVNKPCHEGAASPLLEETVAVNENGTLANVFVYLASVPASDGSAREPALLDQKDCRYTPHVVGVQVGQTLRIRSSDPTMHNVHCQSTANPARNFGMSGADEEKPVTFDKPEFIRVKCDVHPWMTAYIGVFESPFFAATGEGDGKFEIAKVPAGDYKIVAWHEQYGTIEQRVSVKDNEAAELNFEFKAP